MSLIIAAFLLFVGTNAENICPSQGRECDSSRGECCSQYGWCGQGESYCANANRYDFTESDLTSDNCCPCDDEEQPPTPQPPPTSQPPPTPQPPPETFDEHCNCIIYGDPHWVMWNCELHHWQGPHLAEDSLNVYAMTQCNGYTTEDMPFDLIGVTQRYDDYFTSLDYTILKLFNDGSNICIKNKGDEGVSYNFDCSDDYIIKPEQNEVITFASELYESDMFEISWKFENGYSKLFFRVLNSQCVDENNQYDLIITTQTVQNELMDMEEAVEIRVSDCYKEYTCGMCGDFYNTGLTFQTVDGNIIQLDASAWGGTANDPTGLTYIFEDDTAVPFTTTEIPQRRMALEEHSNIVIGEPCFGLRPQLEVECNTHMKQYAECCWDRREFCEDLIVSCGWDSCSCVMGRANNVTQAQEENTIGMCITSVVNASMSFTCGLEADSFAVPDVLRYNEVDKESGNVKDVVCKDYDEIVYLFIGFIAATVVWGIVGGFMYLCVIKQKLEEKQLSSIITGQPKDNMPSDSEAGVATTL